MAKVALTTTPSSIPAGSQRTVRFQDAPDEKTTWRLPQRGGEPAAAQTSRGRSNTGQTSVIKYTELLAPGDSPPPPLPPKMWRPAQNAGAVATASRAPHTPSGDIAGLAQWLRSCELPDRMEVHGALHPATQRGRHADPLVVSRRGDDILLQRRSELGSYAVMAQGVSKEVTRVTTRGVSQGVLHGAPRGAPREATRGVTVTPDGVLWNGAPLPSGDRDDMSSTEKRVMERLQQAMNGVQEHKRAPLAFPVARQVGAPSAPARSTPLADLRATFEHVRSRLPEGHAQVVEMGGHRYRVTVGLGFALQVESVARPGLSLVVSPDGAMTFTMPPIDHRSSAATVRKAAQWLEAARQAADRHRPAGH